jgi:hypothetical protein
MFLGQLRSAFTASPPSFEKPGRLAGLAPAMVLTTPEGEIIRMRLSPLSATYRLLELSVASPPGMKK